MMKLSAKCALIAVGLSLAGCMGGGSRSPATSTLYVPFGDGTASSPYNMPWRNPDGYTGKMDDLFAAYPGYWQILIMGPATMYRGLDLTGLSSLSYDPAAGSWVSVSSDTFGNPNVTRTLSYDGTTDYWGAQGWYVGCTSDCSASSADATYLRYFDADPATGQYGTFGIWRDRLLVPGGTDTNTYEAFYTGLRTDPTKMPAGGATYNASYEAILSDIGTGETRMATGGAMQIAVTFGAGNTVTATTTTAASFANLDTLAVSLDGIMGDSWFDGSAAATYHDAAAAADYSMTGGISGGEFFGPAAEEIAGKFILTGGPSQPDVTIVGGFWGVK